MFQARVKLSRLVVVMMMVFIVSDLMPHPSLSPGIIETTFLEIQALITTHKE